MRNETKDGGKVEIKGIIKVRIFESESCTVADQDAETIKMQITGQGGFGKWGFLPRNTNKFYEQPQCSLLPPCKPEQLP